MADVLGKAKPIASAQVRRITWADEAVSNLDSIAAYVHDFNPLAAQRLALRLRSAADSLAEHPDRGRPIGRGLRELVIVPPYLIRYRVKGDGVEIISIRHGARAPD